MGAASSEDKALQMLSTSTPVFVVGPLRSGTSLLYAILNQHPDIALMYECDVWDFPDFLSTPRFKRDWHTRLEFYNRSLSRHGLNFGENGSNLESVRKPEDLYRAFAGNKDARLFGEKSPFYCTRMRQLAKNHPGSSFILIWRDPVEIHKSIEDAAQKSRYFRRPGTLNRLIHYQEQMIHEAAQLSRSGSRIYHVTYPDLIDRTEESCRGICQFLNIEFDKKMLSLDGADLSAVYQTPQHEYLRNGIIKRRRQLSNNGHDPRAVRKLQRYRNRWNRMRREVFNHQTDVQEGGEPALPERLYHQAAGSFISNMDASRRALFEFLPLPWLRTYRQVKAWFLGGRTVSKANPQSVLDEFLSNKATVLLSFAILAIVGWADYVTGVAVSLAPFYLIPASILTLVINQRWGTFGAVMTAVVWAVMSSVENPIVNFSHPGVWLWDLLMRFLVLEIVVLLLGRIRAEVVSQKHLTD